MASNVLCDNHPEGAFLQQIWLLSVENFSEENYDAF